MPEIFAGVVDLYVYRERQAGPCEYLLLRRASGRLYAGDWRMVAGKIRDGEQAWQTAVRELWEETGQHPVSLFAVPSLNRFYEWQTDRVMLIPVFAGEVRQDPVLDDEHDAFAWLPLEEAQTRLHWPEQRRLLALVDQMLSGGNIPEALRIPVQ